MDWRGKIISMDALPDWRAALRTVGRKLAATNGCFDILHAGHVNYLAAARAQADALLVGLNSDASVRALKGEGRPIQGEADRATVLAAPPCDARSAAQLAPPHRSCAASVSRPTRPRPRETLDARCSLCMFTL